MRENYLHSGYVQRTSKTYQLEILELCILEEKEVNKELELVGVE